MGFADNFWPVEKLESRIKEIEKKRYHMVTSIPTFSASKADDGKNGIYPTERQFDEQMALGDFWQGLDQYLWLKTEVTLPEKKAGERIVGLFNFGTTEGGNNAGFEGLMFLNQHPYQGIDTNHQEVLFSDDFSKGKVQFDFRLWSGLPGDSGKEKMVHQLVQADLGYLNEKIDFLYYQSQAILQVIKETKENDYHRIELIKLLNDAFKIIRWDSANLEDEKHSLEEASDYLKAQMPAYRKESDLTISAMGHAHTDVAWLWRLKHTREKIARTFSSVLHLMDEYPDYHFLQSMPQLYDYIKHDYPEIYQRIKEKVKKGQWEVEGGMWVEADCNIPNGESLTRQLLMGKEFYEKEFGIRSRTLWLPDVFGYSWALPQILNLSGINTFMTTKLGWNEYNRLPSDTFHWKGMDGTEILTHIITTPDDVDMPGFTYNSQVTAEAIWGTWNNYQEKNVNQDLLFAYGYGDGGGGPNREMLEMVDALNELDGMPEIKQTTIKRYFKDLKNTVDTSDEYIHTWNGELYFEFHRGTYTSQSKNKKFNRQFELALRKLEILISLNADASLRNSFQEELHEMWKILLRNQFHDIIPGSSIKEVYEDSEKEYLELGRRIEEVRGKLITEIAENQNQLFYFNDSQYTDERSLTFETNRKNLGFMAGNEELESQKIPTGYLIHLPKTNAFSYGMVTIVEKKEIMPVEEKNWQSFETKFYTVGLSDNGTISYLFDKKNNREITVGKEALNEFQVFIDKPIQFDAWNIDSFYQEQKFVIDELLEAKLTKGILRQTLTLTWRYKASTVHQEIHFYQHTPRIDFDTTVDWHEPSTLLKVAFPVDIQATEARFDIQYGNVTRPTHWNTSWDFAKYETVGHQWADLGERDYGISLMNNCKYGYDIKDHVMRLTLIKSAEYPDATQDIGQHEFSYALYPHKGDFVDGNVTKEAFIFNTPLKGTTEKGETTAIFNIDSNHIFVDALKPAEDGNGLILRLHEYGGMKGVNELTLIPPVKEISVVNLMEEATGEKVNMADNKVDLPLRPYEIKSFRIVLDETK